MKMLRELLELNEQEVLSEKKRDNTISVELPKQRNKQLNDVLKSKKGGRHHAEGDYVRAKEKQKVRRDLSEDSDE